MVFYKIVKQNVLIGIGFSQSGLPQECKTFCYIKITETEYHKLDKKEFNGKDRVPNKHKKRSNKR
jgi:hypothetical protein